MSRNVFIAPGSKEHINRSVLPETFDEKTPLKRIEGLVEIDSIKDALTTIEEATLRHTYEDGKVRLWGSKPGLKYVWDDLNNGDYVLFYRQNHFIAAGEIVYKTVNANVAEKVWGKDKDGQTWDNIFFISNVQKLSIHRKEFSKIVGYTEDFVPRGFMKVAKNGAAERIMKDILENDKTERPKQATPTFTFIEKDFDSCTGKREDAIYLSARFREFRDSLRPFLGKIFEEFLDYVAHPNLQPKRGQRKVKYRDHMWTGFAHPKFKRAQKGIQLQVGINSDQLGISIWIDKRAPEARSMAQKNLEENKEFLLSQLNSLEDFEIGLDTADTHTDMSHPTHNVDSGFLQQFADNMTNDQTHVYVEKSIDRESVLSTGSDIIVDIAGAFDKLYPAYLLFIDESERTIENMISHILSEGFYYPEETIKNYHTSLETKPFVILSGITGIGKTKLTQLYANAFHNIRQNNKFYEIIPVQPNWNDRKPLLGYYNPIMQRYYTTPFLNFLLRAHEDCLTCERNNKGKCIDVSECTRKYFVCLDEMNLAHVEHYFADFLSAMESERKIVLHSKEMETEDGRTLPPDVEIPENLYITGTVNIDETTKEFSPKVLDRANTIFLNLVDLNRWREVQESKGNVINQDAFQTVKDIHELLRDHEMHFGYRVCHEILEYVEKSVLPEDRALDLSIMQKILPKFSGDDNARLRGSLTDLQKYMEAKPYSSSKSKVKNMLQKLDQQGFTSFFD